MPCTIVIDSGNLIRLIQIGERTADSVTLRAITAAVFPSDSSTTPKHAAGLVGKDRHQLNVCRRPDRDAVNRDPIGPQGIHQGGETGFVAGRIDRLAPSPI